MKKALPVLLFVLIAAGVSVWWYQHTHRSEQLFFTGFVEGEEKVIKSEVSGRVMNVTFTDGAQVKYDDVLIEVDARDYRSQVTQQELNLALLKAKMQQAETRLALARETYPTQLRAAKSNLAKASSDLEFAQKEFVRRKELLEAEQLSQQRFDQAKNQLDAARAALTREQEAVANAEANLRQIQVAEDALEVLRRQLAVETERLKQMQIILDKYTIRSPCDCTVQTRLIRTGEYVTPGVGVAALLDPLDKYVRIYIPVPDLGKVRVGDRVRIEPDALPGEFFPGEISFIEDMAQFTPKNIEVRSDRITQVFATKVRILDQVERLKPGMEGTVFLDGQAKPPITTATPTSTSSS
ncbi:MAG TPA: efflux RND transporter periplasmic adaptor subunit [Methylomirabilota bacterium]|nr:efflux RND transporter periplasmic adaptor subunit [Methylomirabilota bacterium]